ncbi:MAG TPA: hypothetical protein PJ991_08965 [Kiritimatiellia bacterium]|nr:hypothetical protein [Kiritimatiellia bacterium]
MKTHRIQWLFLLAVAIVAGILTGCHKDSYSHKPPAGQGAIYVVNNTGSDINVFINGERQDRVGARKKKAYDRPPGIYRIVLDQRNGDRTFRDDVDVLEGRLTIVDVAVDPTNFTDYDVAIFFRTP